MAHVEFIVSNNRHHIGTVMPVLKGLAAVPGYTCGLISLAELRGMASPDDLPGKEGTALPITRVAPAGLRRMLALPPRAGVGERWTRRLTRAAGWHLWLGPRLRRRLETADLVVTPNDGAFPYDRICARLRQAGVPFLLLQEGIRFPRPAGADVGYGRGGAAAVAAWGESSAAYFRSRGVPADRIFLTGSPRFDGLFSVDWNVQAAALGRRLGVGSGNLLVLSSPIDMMGYCTTREKDALMTRLLEGMAPLLVDSSRHVLVKLHAAESAADVAALIARLPDPSRFRVLDDAPLYPLFRLAQAVIVFASTAGLEAMLFGVPVGVVELPGVGFIHDYVATGAALGLSWASPLAAQLTALLAPSDDRVRAMATYVRENLATLEGAADRIVKLICEMVPVG